MASGMFEVLVVNFLNGGVLVRFAEVHVCVCFVEDCCAESDANKLFKEIAPKYADRNGGYTRVTRLGPRRGDAAEMAVIELV